MEGRGKIEVITCIQCFAQEYLSLCHLHEGRLLGKINKIDFPQTVLQKQSI